MFRYFVYFVNDFDFLLWVVDLKVVVGHCLNFSPLFHFLLKNIFFEFLNFFEETSNEKFFVDDVVPRDLYGFVFVEFEETFCLFFWF